MESRLHPRGGRLEHPRMAPAGLGPRRGPGVESRPHPRDPLGGRARTAAPWHGKPQWPRRFSGRSGPAPEGASRPRSAPPPCCPCRENYPKLAGPVSWNIRGCSKHPPEHPPPWRVLATARAVAGGAPRDASRQPRDSRDPHRSPVVRSSTLADARDGPRRLRRAPVGAPARPPVSMSPPAPQPAPSGGVYGRCRTLRTPPHPRTASRGRASCRRRRPFRRILY